MILSRDKLNLTKIFLAGKLNVNGAITTKKIQSIAMQIPLLKKYYDIPLEDIVKKHNKDVTLDIISSINNLEGRRALYYDSGTKSYVSFEQMYNNEETYQKSKFSMYLQSALRFSGGVSDKSKALLTQLIESL